MSLDRQAKASKEAVIPSRIEPDLLYLLYAIENAMHSNVPVPVAPSAPCVLRGRTGWAVSALGGCALWLAAVLPAGAQEGTDHQFYGLGEVPQFSKRIISMRERRYQDIIQQRFDFSCGAAATATILRYAYNFDVNEVDVILGLAKVADEEIAREKGYSLLDIRHYVETLGLRGRGYELPLEMLPKLRIPTIALLDLRGYKHFVVLRRVTEDSVYVGDPALGNRIMPLDDFKKSWNGAVFAILGRGFDRETVLTRPTPPLTARKFLYDHTPVTDSDLLDFGFTHADLF